MNEQLRLTEPSKKFLENIATAIVGSVNKMEELLGRQLTPEERGYALAALTNSATLHIERRIRETNAAEHARCADPDNCKHNPGELV